MAPNQADEHACVAERVVRDVVRRYLDDRLQDSGYFEATIEE